MANSDCHEFQQTVSEYLVRHRSILDTMSKFQEAAAHVNRAIVKSVTACGCLQISADKQPIPEGASLDELDKFVRSHVQGELCPACSEIIETELGNALFYLAAICNLLDVDLKDVMGAEKNRVATLGVFSLT